MIPQLAALCAVLVGASDARPVALAYEARASRTADDGATVSLLRLRVEDKRLAGLLAAGMAASPTLRTLVERIESSDLIVYVRPEMTLNETVAARMVFLTRAGGCRYLDIRVGYIGSRTQQIALIGHELRHAVEVAETPAIVDLRSFEREYKRMGHVVDVAKGAGRIAFETDAAVQTSQQIVRELLRDTD